MSEKPASSPTSVQAAWTALLERASGLSARALAWGSLALAVVILLSVNLIASVVLKSWKADLTADRLFTISDGTYAVLRAIDEPIKVHLFFSTKLGEIAPSHARYFDRIRTLLEQYQDISGGKLELEFLDPEPFSDVEDRAVAAGLRGIRLNAEGETGYFGLAAVNSTDNQQVIPFLSPDRESFVEYDITKIVHALSNPKKRVVGLITGLPLDGGKSPFGDQPTPPWMIMEQIREFFEVEKIDEDAREIRSDIDVLLVAQPTGLTPAAAYAIDQYALKGGKVLALIDPLAETAHLQMLEKGGEGRNELAKLIKAWGVGFDGKKVAADIRYARRVQFGNRRTDNMVTEYVSWLGLDRSAIDERDVLSSGIEILNLASAGILSKVDGATADVTPILATSTDAMPVETKNVGMTSDPVALLRAYAPGGKQLVLAARISGEAQSAFPDGMPKPEEKKDETAGEDAPNAAPSAKSADADKSPSETTNAKGSAVPPPAGDKGPHIASGRINAIVVADTDLLADQFWVESREFMGHQVVTPNAHNAAFVVGALENLSGSDALIALRGRGVKERRFTLVESLRRDAERDFREKEQALTEKLKNIEQELRKLESSGDDGSVILSDAEREAAERIRGEMLATRSELRKVKLALRHEIDRLDGWLKFANIALVPLMVGLLGLGWSVWQSRRRKDAS